MKLRDAALTALGGIGRHWGRATLNVSGILAGVASIVLLVGVAQSVGRASHAEVAGLGADLVVVYPSGVSSSGVQAGFGPGSTLTAQDALDLNNPAYVPDGTSAVPTAGQRAPVVGNARQWTTDVLGSTDAFLSARGYTIQSGRFFNGADVTTGNSQVVLGASVAGALFPTTGAVGQQVQINGHSFTVAGVFASRGYSGSFNQDDLVVMPITALWSYVLPINSPRIEQIFVVATSPSATGKVKEEITNRLLQAHKISNPALADFQVQTQQDLVLGAERLGNLMTWMLAAIAVISLLTGAIAVMTLMLASVRERAYEIGIRRAVGASRPAIMSQFLFEALLLAGFGGVVGIALGIGGASVMGSLITDIPAPTISLTAIVLAVVAAIVVGLAAGLYPAARAATMAPAEALRR